MGLSVALTDGDNRHVDGLSVAVWLFCVAALVFVMIVVGGATRLTDSGLSITEWKPLLGAIPPLTTSDWFEAFEKYKQIPEYKLVNKGMSLDEFKFIYWWEWAHRFLGRFIGLAFALPLVLFWVGKRLSTQIKPKLIVLLLLGALQGAVGWYMVSSGLVDRVDVSQYRLAMHLGLAFIILAALLWVGLDVIAANHRKAHLSDSDDIARLPTGALKLSIAVAVLIFVQVILGAFVAGTKAGLTYNTWPLMDGDFIPVGLNQLQPWYLNLAENITAIQFNHRMAAYIVLAAVTIQAVRFLIGPCESKPRLLACLLAGAMALQAILGIATLLSAEGSIPIGLGLAHQGGAAVVFALAIWHLHALWCRRS